MKRPAALNPIAKRFSRRLLSEHPVFRAGLEILEDGHFEASIAAPEGSRAGFLICRTVGEDVWIRFAPPQACYPAESEDELVQIVKALLEEQAVMVVISKDGEWAGTTLIQPGRRPRLKKGESAKVYSWSGRLDLDVPAGASPRPRKKGSARPAKVPSKAGRRPTRRLRPRS